MNLTDEALLDSILAPANEPELSEYERAAFFGMRGDLWRGKQHKLSVKQRRFAGLVWDRIKPIDASSVPRGCEVVPPEVLRRPLPKRPPGTT